MKTRMTLGLLLLLAGAALAGPLSRGGWGRIEWTGNAADMGRGGAGLAQLDTLRINLRNPAALHSGRLTRLQLGFGGAREQISDNAGGSHSETVGRFDSFLLSFPLTWRETSLAVGLRPFSRMNFALSSRGTNDENEEYYEFLKGSGGFSLATLGAGKAWLDGRLQTGVELGFFFGSLRQEYSLYHTAAAPPFDVANNYRLGANGYSMRFGLVAQVRPGLSLGLVYRPATPVDLLLDQESASNDRDRQVDLGSSDLPSSLELGLRWQRGNWVTHMDLSWEDWSSTTLGTNSSGTPVSRLQDAATGLAFGFERVHENDFTVEWYRKWDWRSGFRLRNEYLAWNALQQQGGLRYEDLLSTTLSLGCSIPTRARRGWLDLALEYSMLGGESDLGLEERTTRLRVTFAGSDLWFLRRSYD